MEVRVHVSITQGSVCPHVCGSVSVCVRASVRTRMCAHICVYVCMSACFVCECVAYLSPRVPLPHSLPDTMPCLPMLSGRATNERSISSWGGSPNSKYLIIMHYVGIDGCNAKSVHVHRLSQVGVVLCTECCSSEPLPFSIHMQH